MTLSEIKRKIKVSFNNEKIANIINSYIDYSKSNFQLSFYEYLNINDDKSKINNEHFNMFFNINVTESYKEDNNLIKVNESDILKKIYKETYIVLNKELEEKDIDEYLYLNISPKNLMEFLINFFEELRKNKIPYYIILPTYKDMNKSVKNIIKLGTNDEKITSLVNTLNSLPKEIRQMIQEPHILNSKIGNIGYYDNAYNKKIVFITELLKKVVSENQAQEMSVLIKNFKKLLKENNIDIDDIFVDKYIIPLKKANIQYQQYNELESDTIKETILENIEENELNQIDNTEFIRKCDKYLQYISDINLLKSNVIDSSMTVIDYLENNKVLDTINNDKKIVLEYEGYIEAKVVIERLIKYITNIELISLNDFMNKYGIYIEKEKKLFNRKIKKHT